VNPDAPASLAGAFWVCGGARTCPLASGRGSLPSGSDLHPLEPGGLVATPKQDRPSGTATVRQAEEKRWPREPEGSEPTHVVQAPTPHHVRGAADEDAAAAVCQAQRPRAPRPWREAVIGIQPARDEDTSPNPGRGYADHQAVKARVLEARIVDAAAHEAAPRVTAGIDEGAGVAASAAVGELRDCWVAGRIPGLVPLCLRRGCACRGRHEHQAQQCRENQAQTTALRGYAPPPDARMRSRGCGGAGLENA
jgi:hypothetical protein